MTEFSSDKCGNRFIYSVNGHCFGAPKGEDVVCAAISTLTYLVYFAAKELDDEGLLESFYHSVVSGSAEMDFTVKEEGMERASFIYDVVNTLVLEIESEYPSNVRTVI